MTGFFSLTSTGYHRSPKRAPQKKGISIIRTLSNSLNIKDYCAEGSHWTYFILSR